MGGIVDFDVRFPASYLGVKEMSASSGVPEDGIRRITHGEGFPVLGEREQAWELAAEAARAVLGGHDPTPPQPPPPPKNQHQGGPAAETTLKVGRA
ncbi:hypothetical protein ACFVZS_20905, partial [Streptomyces abikoensis]